jgi:hypothetical protein
MGAEITVFCPAGQEGLSRSDLEDLLEGFFGDAAEEVGAGSGIKGFDLAFELAEGEPPDQWGDQLRGLLRIAGVCPGTVISIYPAGWEPGMEWRRVEVFGSDTRRT